MKTYQQQGGLLGFDALSKDGYPDDKACKKSSAKSIHYLFCHGFGFSPYWWHKIATYWQAENCQYLDLGYFSSQEECILKKSPGSLLIGIGHSLGLIKLLSLSVKFDALIGLNGFVNFLGGSQRLHEKRAQELEKLMDDFTCSPLATLRGFYRRCGIDWKLPLHQSLNKVIALRDLYFLRNTYCIPENIPTLIMGCKDDLIVPQEIILDNFQACSQVKIEILDSGSHGLGWLETKRVHNKMVSFIEEVLDK